MRAAALTLALAAWPSLLAACGDDGGGPSDAAIDAPFVTPVDAPTDGPPPVTYGGTISLLETQLLAPGAAGTLYGEGLQVGIDFTSSELAPRPLMEEQAGSPLGCKAWQYAPAQAAAVAIGLDEGPVTITATAGTNRPTLPTCVHVADAGYVCPHASSTSGGGTIAIVAAGQTASLTDFDVTYTDASATDAYVTIRGAAHAANDGTFPIVGHPGASVIVYANPAAVAETLPATASHQDLAAAGPIPGVADPGFLADDVAVTFALAAGGDGHLPAFTATTAPGTVGDDFTIAAAEAAKLNAIPLTGAAFTIGCDAASCGTASGTVLDLVTTDAPVAGLSPFAMPPPVTHRIEVRCAMLGATSITVGAAYAQLLAGSGATRVQASFLRPALLTGGPASVNAIAGHALVGYTTR
ncbi:MAG TPA: hypothetical protein VHE35_19065 [Kofleriaceae bacterium]|nr:hypothetical protein [Kofleriaceae bacterium]